MRAPSIALIAVVVLTGPTSAIRADVLCAVNLAGYTKDIVKDHAGRSTCLDNERQVDLASAGLHGSPEQNAPKGMAIYDCSVCTEGRLSPLSTCEFIEPTGSFGHPPAATEGVKTTTKQCKLVGYLLSP
jgi:hypothetical protein